MPEITSLQNARVKAAIKLRDGRHRQKQGRFIIDGLRELTRAVRAGITIREMFHCRELCTPDQSQGLDALLDELQAASGAAVECIAVSRAVFKKTAFGNRTEGVLGVADVPDWKLSDLTLPKNALVAVIEGIEKPGNIGAVVRSADAAGLDAMILADCRTDLFNPNAIRASLGTIFSFPLRTADTKQTIAWLGDRELPIYAARVDASTPYTQIDFRPGGAIILGSESAGLSESWTDKITRPIRLPMRGAADSLNISTTAAVLFYEALRQRSG